MPKFFELSVSLRDVIPRPIRRFRIRATSTFAELNDAIMAATGWTGAHLWAFFVERFGDEIPVAAPLGPDGEFLELGGLPTPDAQRMRLPRQFGIGYGLATQARYLYDFGDDWQADVLVHDLLVLKEKRTRMLVSAEFPWPPEDCGGPGGYEQLREAMGTGDDPEGFIEWARNVWGWTGQLDVEQLRARFDR